MLQHGEILLEPSKQLWKKVFHTDPPKTKSVIKEKEKIIDFLKESLIKTWPNLQFLNYKLDEKDKEIINRLAIDNFKETNYL